MHDFSQFTLLHTLQTEPQKSFLTTILTISRISECSSQSYRSLSGVTGPPTSIGQTSKAQTDDSAECSKDGGSNHSDHASPQYSKWKPRYFAGDYHPDKMNAEASCKREDKEPRSFQSQIMKGYRYTHDNQTDAEVLE
ncbi:hypothetical protein DMJ13_22935 [halophilic archaeon]|nr:hypothetical protein DMJ13_22935 [halophilic archaeon]